MLYCPQCSETDIVSTSKQLFRVNTGEYLKESVKIYDLDAESACLDCDWEGTYGDLFTHQHR